MKKTHLHLSYNSSEFHSLALKLRNLSKKIDSLLSTGKFWEFSKSQQQTLIAKLRRLFEKLSGINHKYALKIAGAALCFTLISTTAKALPTFNDFNPNNPFTFDEIFGNDLEDWNIIDGAFADIDDDGDNDAILLVNSCGNVQAAYFENVNGIFTENSTSDNPFSFTSGSGELYYDVFGVSGIDMADFDGDGDLDAILAYSPIRHYQLVSGKFSYVSGSWLNNQSGCSTSICAEKAKFGDVDDDGDLDIVGTICCGAIARSLIQDASHNFERNYCAPASCNIANYGSSVHINMADMDGDGDDDFFVFANNTSASSGLTAIPSQISYHENLGGGNFSPSSNIPLPPNGMSSVFFPLLADIDDDGDFDVFTPGDGGSTTFENLGGNAVPISPFVALLAFVAAGFGIFNRNRKKKVE
jgi:hypothetical protein